MRRIVIWFASTVTVVVLMFGYHTSTNRAASTGLAPISASSSPSADPTSTSSSESGTSSSSSSSSSSTPSAKSSAKSSASSGTKTYTGTQAETRWGPVQVKITVTDGSITAVDVPVFPQENPRDQQINSYAVPTLVEETIKAQNADIDMVSGATVTSDGYLQSLQSALDEAGLS